MKKYFSYALVGAIALTGAVGFSSCSSSSDEVVGNNPSYNSEQSSVKTQFTISFSKNVASTRQSEGIVQAKASTPFRGMDNIVLLPFGVAGAVNTDPIGSTLTKLGKAIELKNIIYPSQFEDLTNSIPASTLTDESNSNSVLYNDVTIPVGTGSFLFYGKAIDGGVGTNNFLNGYLKMEGNQPGTITFTPLQTYPSSTTASTVGEALATYISNIAKAEHWAECGTEANKTQSWYNLGLSDLYTKFTSMKAGSSRTVQAAVQDLYSTIKDNTDAVSTAIIAAITDADYVSSSEGGVLTFKAVIGNSEDTYFPGDKDLPDGAALLSYNSGTKTFTQVTNGSGNTGQVTAKYADYVYPASLYYYCNSGIKTSNSSQATAYNGSDSWATISGKYKDGTSVSTSTRSVAILDPIQYGVGRLEACVKLGDATTLYDKNGDAYNVIPNKGFTVTGILIGGQKQVVYNFTPTTDTDAPSYTIYDNITKSNGTINVYKTTASDPNYTLALETEADVAVYVAVELLNNGADFQGKDGVVPAGCKFYLVAQLDPSKGSGYVSETMDQVFKQDHKTIVNFTIPKGYAKTEDEFNPETPVGLGRAYNTIPDLRTPKLELGLSVDLTWETGIEFDVEFK